MYFNRNYGTNRHGGPFDAATIQIVWNKGQIVWGKDPALWRKDSCGALMYRHDYGKTTLHGWEIDHIQPVAKDGPDDLWNLQPLQWENNRYKSDNYPGLYCKIRA